MIILLASLGALALLFLCSRNWRVSVQVAMYVVVLEGALRKWVLPQASELIYFLKDGILLGAYIGYFVYSRAPFRSLLARGALMVVLALTSLVLFLQMLNPALNSILVGLLGAKGYLLYVPLAFLLPDAFRNVGELQSFLRWYLLFCIPVCLLGIAQFFAPAESWINTYAISAVDVDVVTFEEGNVRVTGTFPFLVGFAMYLTFNIILVFALLVHQRTWRWRLVMCAAVLLIVIDSFMTGSRSVVFANAIVLAGFTFYSIFERSSRSRSLAIWLIVAGAVCVAVSIKAFPTAVDAFTGRATAGADSVTDRVIESFMDPLAGVRYSGVGGYGAGATQVACWALRDQLRLGPPLAYPPPSEAEPLRVMLELGAFGFVLWYALRIYFLFLLWRTTRTLRHPMLRHLALAAFLFHAFVLNGQLVTNTTVGVFYWFLAGFAFLLPRLDRQTLAALRSKQPPRRLGLPGKPVPILPPPLTPAPTAL